MSYHVYPVDDLIEHDLDEAALLAERAVQIADGDVRPAWALLGNVLSRRYESTHSGDDLDAAIAAVTQAVAGEGPDVGLLLGNLTGLLGTRYWFRRDPADLDRARAAGERALGLPMRDQDRAGTVANLATIYRHAYLHDRGPGDLERATDLAREAVRLAPAHPQVGGHIYNLALMVLERFWQTRDPAALQEAITLARQSISATPPGHPELARYRMMTASALALRGERTASLSDFREAVAVATAAEADLTEDHPERADVLRQRGFIVAAADRLAASIADHLHGDVSGLVLAAEQALKWAVESADAVAARDAVRILKHVVGALPEDHFAQAGLQSSLATALTLAYQRSGDVDALSEAVAHARMSLARTPDGHQDRARRLALLAQVLSSRHLRTHNPADVEHAVALAREAVESTDEPGEQRRLRADLSIHLRTLFEAARRPQDLEEAVRQGRLAIEGMPADEVPANRANLARALLMRHGLSGDPADLEEAVALGRLAASAVADGHIYGHQIHEVAAVALGIRFDQAADPADLDEAIMHRRAAFRAVPHPHPAFARCAFDLAASLYRRGRPEELDETLRCARIAAEAADAELLGRSCELLASTLGRVYREAPDADTDRELERIRAAVVLTALGDPHYLGSLTLPDVTSAFAGLVLDRYLVTADGGLLDEGITRLRSALSSAPEHVAAGEALARLLFMRFEERADLADVNEVLARPTQGSAQGILLRGFALSRRAAVTGAPADLDEAVDLLAAALSHTGTSDDLRVALLTGLGSVLRERFEAHRDQADLHRAHDHCAQARDLAPDDSRVLSNLAGVLRRIAGETGDTAALDEAVTLLRRVVDSAPGSATRLNLGGSLYERYQRNRDVGDLTAAIDAYRAAAVDPQGPAKTRMDAAQQWISAAGDMENVAWVLDAFTAAVDLLPILAWRGLARSGREETLTRYAWLPASASAAALRARGPEYALQLLEQSRSVLWSQTLQTRSDIGALRTSHPRVAGRLNELRHTLNTMG